MQYNLGNTHYMTDTKTVPVVTVPNLLEILWLDSFAIEEIKH